MDTQKTNQNQQQDYKAKLEAQLSEWSAQTKLLGAKLNNAGADLKLQYSKELEELQGKQQEATAKLKELAEAGSEVWDKVKAGADELWEDIKTRVSTMASKMGQGADQTTQGTYQAQNQTTSQGQNQTTQSGYQSPNQQNRNQT